MISCTQTNIAMLNQVLILLIVRDNRVCKRISKTCFRKRKSLFHINEFKLNFEYWHHMKLIILAIKIKMFSSV